jgi:inhibitor of nuclear factor kappa-B kinase subunit alpha
VYQEDVLQGVVKYLNMTIFSGQKWVFQQDSAPAHKAKTTQEWLRRHVPAFISAEDWPSGSPNLNPMDYKLWAVLGDMAAQKHHNNLDSLKRSLVKAVAEILLETVCAATAVLPEHLKFSIEAEGGHFEWHYYK